MPLFQNTEQSREFARSLKTKSLGKTIDYVERTASTNDLALTAGRSGAEHGKLFIAEVQSSGRGRRGRTWESPPDKSLLFSVLVRLGSKAEPQYPAISPADYGWLPLIAGLACSEAAASVARIDLTMKWPNDVVVPASSSPGWRKLGGILCESVLTQPGEAGGFVVIGIGLNINQNAEELPPLAKAPPSSLYLEIGQTLDRAEVLRAALERLETHLLALSQSTNAELKAEIQKTLGKWWLKKTLCVEASNAESNAVINGTYGGLDEFGRLKLIRSSGRETVLADAEILSVV